MDKYLARSADALFDHMCLAEFCAQYRITASTTASKTKPDSDSDDDAEQVSKQYLLKKGLGKIQRRSLF